MGQLNDINLNEKKVFIDKKLWYIENFLNEKELEELMRHANEETKWYKTSRSPSIKNKFIGVKVEVHPQGTICPTRKIDLSGDAIFPDENNLRIEEDLLIFNDKNGISKKLQMVLPKTLVSQNTLQSFWPLSEEEKMNPGGAYKWHYEKGMNESFNDNWDDSGMTAAWSVYLNDDFEGGLLEFLNKPYLIKSKPGMLISIPMGKEFTHRVTPVIKGIRHTLYGTCFNDVKNRPISTGENC